MATTGTQLQLVTCIGILLIKSGRFVLYLRVKVLLNLSIQRFKFQLNILNSVQRE